MLGAANLTDGIWRFAAKDQLASVKYTIEHGVNDPSDPQTRDAVMPKFGGGKLSGDPSRDTIVDLMTADGRVLPTIVDKQIPRIANLRNDYSRFIDENGTQLQTVGHHWTLSQPLDAEQRAKVDRQGMCLSCHKEMPVGDLAVSAMVHATKMAGIEIDKKEHGTILNKLLLIGAWLQLLVGILIGSYIIYRLFFKRKNPRRWK
jgi:hypothetical protein